MAPDDAVAASPAAVAALEERPNWGRRILIGVALLVGAVIAYLIGAAVIPRWWAQRIGDFVDGRISVGATLGVFVGIVFTILPLLVLWAAFRWRGGWRRVLVFLAIALLVAVPNLMTLGIVAGDGSAAHARERILDVDGPGFRGGTLVGVILGVLTFGLFAYLVASRGASRRRVAHLQAERRAAAAAASAAGASAPSIPGGAEVAPEPVPTDDSD
jgi:hypothetical protein